MNGQSGGLLVWGVGAVIAGLAYLVRRVLWALVRGVFGGR
jgi:hypothetical protein